MNNYYEVIAVSAEKDRLVQYGLKNKVDTFHVEMTRAITPIRDLKAVLRLFWFLKKEKPLIVHTHTPKAGIIGMLAASLAGVPIRLHTVAGLPLLETRGLKRKILDLVEKLTYKLATRVYPNSVELKRICFKSGYAREEKLKVLGKGSSNGIDTNYFDPAKFSEDDQRILRKELNIPQDDLVFIFVGRLVTEKGINELVKAFEKLNSEIDNITLLLVGPFEKELDPLLPDVYETIKSHKKIITTGYQTDVRPYFSIANILAFPSYREGFPNVVMQANAMSLPVIVTNINGCNEIVKDGVNGIIVEVKSEEGLKTAMKTLVLDENLRENLIANSRKIIQDNYERAQFWQLLLKEYKELEGLYKHD
ncbi:glycosyltransferase family 4 protein [Christiangramia sabulilitoris]|uniref:Glycosyltransferase family 4 protein n=2 Tax=Christiangramia sabulilitoris TaxID=2583991 RepID=A0A550I474_9FLAO|nr:glycosyltransferase family 4 protein [Christiangramia sabulilitoris]